MTTKKAAKGSSATAKKKTPASKAPAKKATAKKAAAKSSAKGSGGSRKYSPEAGKSVEREMKQMHEGKLRSGRGGKKVTNPKQAIAIGLSEARRAGEEVPPDPNR